MPTDVSLYFKHFATVLLATHPSIAILNWENPAHKPGRIRHINPSQNWLISLWRRQLLNIIFQGCIHSLTASASNALSKSRVILPLVTKQSSKILGLDGPEQCICLYGNSISDLSYQSWMDNIFTSQIF